MVSNVLASTNSTFGNNSRVNQTVTFAVPAVAGGSGSSGIKVSITPGSSSKTDKAFEPNPVQAKVGDSVTWINQDTTAHTVIYGANGKPDGKFDSSPNFNPLIAPGQTFAHKFDAAGKYPYYCGLHPNMVGTVTVS